MTFKKEPTDEISPSLLEFVMQAGLGRQPKSDSIFHYTSGAGLCGIVTSGRIYASHARFFNDTSEFEYGLGLLKPLLVPLDEVGLPEVREHIIKTFDGDGGYDIFVSCFCEADDLVPQWRGYGAGGAGYSIGFPWRDVSRDGTAMLIGVIYGDAAVVAAAKQAIALGKDRVEAAKKEGGQAGAAEILDTITSMVVTLLLVVIAAKRDIFAYENEFRLVHLVDRDLPAPDRPTEFRDSHGLIVPYVQLPLPRDPKTDRLRISSVRCGPSLKDVSTIAGVKMLLAKQGLDNVPVSSSEAPLRP